MASSSSSSSSSSRSSPFIIFLTTAVMINYCTSFCSVMASERLVVGDEEGWRQPDANNTDMYTLWSTSNSFYVGDSIYFSYNNDSVLVMDKRGYYHCNTTSPIAAFDDGETEVTLDNAGTFYFISGDVEHCKNGQRLIVDVMPATDTSAPPLYQPPPPGQGFYVPPVDSPTNSAVPELSVSIIGISVAVVVSVVQAFSCIG